LAVQNAESLHLGGKFAQSVSIGADPDDSGVVFEHLSYLVAAQALVSPEPEVAGSVLINVVYFKGSEQGLEFVLPAQYCIVTQATFIPRAILVDFESFLFALQEVQPYSRAYPYVSTEIFIYRPDLVMAEASGIF
ncbi:hypothetical protein ADUPG1_001439, partial [Aduncisulcus paluster]